jgi:hypothetical protein
MTVHVEVLGFECSTCRTAFERIGAVARELGVPIHLEKVSDPARIAAYRVLAVPGVAVDGVLVHSGGVPDRKRIAEWLT